MNLLHSLVVLPFFIRFVRSEFIYELCDLDNNYTVNSTYQTNLNQLRSSLLSSVIPSGFSNYTVGKSPNQVFGLAMCRCDLSVETCQSCIIEIINDASTRCPYGKAEILRYEECYLHYSNINFFSQMKRFDNYMCELMNATDPQRFTTILAALLNTLVSQAASSPEKFAAGFVNYTNLNKLYGLVQCTRDLQNTDCYQCLQSCVDNIPIFCENSIEGRLFGESCSIEFDSTIFYNTSALPNAAVPPSPQAEPPPPQAEPPSPPAAQPPCETGTNVERIALIVVSVVAALAILLAIGACLKWGRKKSKPLLNTPADNNNEDESMGPSEGYILFDLDSIRFATNNFSKDNKLGEGGFGPVYKGILINGQDIAVKRLSGNSVQGIEHLKNEVRLLANLQHKNLVKLFGCCIDEQEKLLVYEYLSNTSLDKFLFDPVKSPKLDWQMRLKIIEGVARGLVYLHEDSRLKIVHRDLKVSNILLDADMNPKIADFGLAKLFNIDATHASTRGISGTYGYMAPEYAMRGQFSTKSDVYSYGVLVLEVLTGRTVYGLPGQMDEDLLSYVWRHWSQGVPMNTTDRSAVGHCSNQELTRCMHIALLCVQDDSTQRPDMATVILMLRSQSMNLPAPTAALFPESATKYVDVTKKMQNV